MDRIFRAVSNAASDSRAPQRRVQEGAGIEAVADAQGEHAAAYAALSNHSAFPLKTPDMFDHDPLNVILNSFSKIQKDGEGAGIQIVFAPHDDYFNKKYAVLSSFDCVSNAEASYCQPTEK